MNKRSYLAVFGLILALGLMASAFILGNQFKNFRQTGSISVKALPKNTTPQPKGLGLSKSVLGAQPIMKQWQKTNATLMQRSPS